MRYLENPLQPKLFDVFQDILSPVAFKRLQQSWEQLFRLVILKLLPATELARHFDPILGRPTKELYSMAGLIFIMEFRDWTQAEAVEAYTFHANIQYALNLDPEGQSLCERTLQRYLKLFREDHLAQQVMTEVTAELVRLLELDISEQRLDSTHIESNMAKFGRVRLMSTGIRNFLEQLKKQDDATYQALPASLRERYGASKNALFGDWKKLDEKGIEAVRQSVAEDLMLLVERFRADAQYNQVPTYLMLATIFRQQCEVIQDKVQLKKKTGGDIICNPSDPDATFDGHKGSGYQVQISETCHSENGVQLILSAIPQTACASDASSLTTVVEDLKENELLPQSLLADTAYGGDSNQQYCEAAGIDLISPTSGKCPEEHVNADHLTAADFQVELRDATDERGRVEAVPTCVACPVGKEPHRSFYDSYLDEIRILQDPKVCDACPLQSKCPCRLASGWSQVTINAKEVRLIERRRHELTDKFRDDYRMRSGIESTNSQLKRVTGLGQLRVRGRPAVFMSVLLKIAGWNILRAASVRELLAKLTKERQSALFRSFTRRFSTLQTWLQIESRAVSGYMQCI